MQIRYCGPSSEGVTLADGSLTFLPGEAVEVPADLGAELIEQGTFEVVAKAAKPTKTEEVPA
jgi:hypothetical protein